MEADVLLRIYIVILVAEFLIEKYTGWLNYRAMKDSLPDEVRGIYDDEKYKKSIAYNREGDKFSFLTSTLNFIIIIILILSGAFGWLDEILREQISNEILLSLSFIGILFVLADLLGTPFDLYGTFVIEEKYGFNKTTPKTYITDKLKGYLLTILIGGGILTVLLLLIQKLGVNFWIYFWVVISLFTLFMNMFYTTLIVPLFNKLIPLEAGDLKKAIQDYAIGVKFPLENVYVIDGSKRSTKANAYFSGIGKKKKIILFDTLINNHSREELVAVLAHEVGHYKKKHIIQGYLSSIFQTGIMLWIMSLMIFSPELSGAFGAQQMGMHLNLLAFGILYSPVSTLTGIIMNVISRKNEYQADAYASTTFRGSELKLALKKLSVNNLGNLTPHPLYVFLNYSHPPLLKRLKAIDQVNDE